MKTFHHVGLPTSQKHDNETYLEGGKLYVTPYDAGEHMIEWLRFEQDSPMPDLLKTTAHVAFQVDDMDEALKGKQILVEPFIPFPGLKAAFIVDNGAPVEYMQVID